MFKLRKSYNPTCNTVTNMMCGYRTYKTLLLLLLYWSYYRFWTSVTFVWEKKNALIAAVARRQQRKRK